MRTQLKWANYIPQKLQICSSSVDIFARGGRRGGGGGGGGGGGRTRGTASSRHFLPVGPVLTRKETYIVA